MFVAEGNVVDCAPDDHLDQLQGSDHHRDDLGNSVPTHGTQIEFLIIFTSMDMDNIWSSVIEALLSIWTFLQNLHCYIYVKIKLKD